jgi:hypothetical protein
MKLIMLIALVAAISFWFFKLRGGRPSTARVTSAKSSSNDSQHHGVSIEFNDATACGAVKRIGSKRFLRGEVPALPLSECHAENCECRYAHYDDRRTGEDDRRLAPTLEWKLSGKVDEPEQRKKDGRRSGD